MGKTMNYKMKHTRRIVITFIVVPLLVLIGALVSIAIRQNMFEKRYHYTTNLENALGVSTQTALLYKGFEIGKVESFELVENGTIRVNFSVFKRYRNLMTDGSVIYRTTIPITNKTSLDYIKAKGVMPELEEGSFIPSTDFADGRALLAQLSPKSSDPIAVIIDNLVTLSSELNKDDNKDKGALMRILVGAADLVEIGETTLNLLNDNLAELSRLTENLNKDDNADQGVVLRAANSVADIAQAVAEQSENLQSMIAALNEAAQNYADPTDLVRKMVDPQGDVLIQPLSETISVLRDNLVASEQLISSLARANPELLLIINNLNDTLFKANQTLEALNNNPLLRKGIPTSRIRSFAPASRIGEDGDED